MTRTAQEWADALNIEVADTARRLGLSKHAAACDIMDWSVINGVLAGIQYANTIDAIIGGDMTVYDFISTDGQWCIRWNPARLTWEVPVIA